MEMYPEATDCYEKAIAEFTSAPDDDRHEFDTVKTWRNWPYNNAPSEPSGEWKWGSRLTSKREAFPSPITLNSLTII